MVHHQQFHTVKYIRCWEPYIIRNIGKFREYFKFINLNNSNEVIRLAILLGDSICAMFQKWDSEVRLPGPWLHQLLAICYWASNLTPILLSFFIHKMGLLINYLIYSSPKHFECIVFVHYECLICITFIIYKFIFILIYQFYNIYLYNL